MGRSRPVTHGDGVYTPRRPRRLSVRWECCGVHLGTTRVRVDGTPDEEPEVSVSVSVEPYGALVREDPAYPVKLRLLCPSCGSDTVMGPDHPGMAATRALGAAYRAGRETAHTWVGDVRTGATRPARIPKG